MSFQSEDLAWHGRNRIKLTTVSNAETDVDYDKHKADSLAKQKRGAGHWKRELSSDSEEAVKADRNSNESIEHLQQRTKRAAEETTKAGTSTQKGL